MLLSAVSPVIEKQDTIIRDAIPEDQCVIVTLRYLATRRSLEDLKFTTGIPAQRLGRIIFETCTVVIHVVEL